MTGISLVSLVADKLASYLLAETAWVKMLVQLVICELVTKAAWEACQIGVQAAEQTATPNTQRTPAKQTCTNKRVFTNS